MVSSLIASLAGVLLVAVPPAREAALHDLQSPAIEGRGFAAQPNRRPKLIESRGRLVDASGAPVAGWTLRIEWAEHRSLGFMGGRMVGEAAEVQTGDDGSFVVSLPASAMGWRLSVQEDGNWFFPWSRGDWTFTEGHLGTLRLSEERVVAGVARAANGTPLAGIDVRIAEADLVARLLPPDFLLHEVDDFLWTLDGTGDGSFISRDGVAVTTTDAQGRFSVRGRYSHPWVVFAGSHGVPHAFPCDPEGAWDAMDLTAHKLDESSREFVLADGRPASSLECAVQVAACWPEHDVLRPMRVPSDGTVEYLAEEMPAHMFGTDGPTAAVRARADVPWLIRSSFWGENDGSPMTVPDAGDLRFRVVDASGAPIEDVQLHPFGILEGMSTEPASSGWAAQFREESPGVFAAADVAPAERGLVLTASGFMRGAVTWHPYRLGELKPDWAAEQTIELHRAVPLEVQVIAAPDDEPLADVLVGIWPGYGDESVCELHGHLELGNAGITDRNGVWSPGVACVRGVKIVAHVAASSCEGTWDGEQDRFVLRTRPLVEFSAEVFDGEEPAPEMVILFQSVNSFGVGALRTDASGRVETMLQTGTYELRAGSERLPLRGEDGEPFGILEVKKGVPIRDLRLFLSER